MFNRCFACIISASVIIFTLVTGLYAEGSIDELKSRIRDLREKKAQLTLEHENSVHNLMKESEDKMAKLKTEFRLAREELLNERNAKAKEMRISYEDKLKPMLKEEGQLIEKIGPSESSNFARTETEKNSR